MKPILFNTEMVRAILNGRKTVTRRVVKPKYSNTDLVMFTNKYGTRLIERQNDVHAPERIVDENGVVKTRNYIAACAECKAPYEVGDILYVRETWCPFDTDHVIDGAKYAYKADATADSEALRKQYGYKWHPSIHMPKEAARIFLRVTNVRVERLQGIDVPEIVAEGAYDDCRECLDCYSSTGSQCCAGKDDECSQYDSVITAFEKIWNSTIKPAALDAYGWNANPWVWVIEFERCEKPEERK